MLQYLGRILSLTLYAPIVISRIIIAYHDGRMSMRVELLTNRYSRLRTTRTRS